MSEFRSMSNVDGVITPTEEARVPVLDRGFLYGDSIYEVFRTYQGVPLFYDEHWARFENSAALVYMALSISSATMLEHIRRTVAATGAAAAGKDVYVRYTVTRGSGPVDLFPNASLAARYVIIVREAPQWKQSFYSDGVSLAVSATRRNPLDALDPNIKGGNYLNNVIGVIEARELGADDSLMLDARGCVTESSNSNIFFVIDGELVTPAQTAGNLRGLTKAAVHAACRDHGRATTECDISETELGGASECFLTSATREVMPVRRLRLGNGEVIEFPAGGGAVTRQVADWYREYVAGYVAGHAELKVV